MLKNNKKIMTNVLDNRLRENYVAGFVHGDGDFSIGLNIRKSKVRTPYGAEKQSNKLKLILVPTFTLTQKKSNILLMERIFKKWNNVGHYMIDSNNIIRYRVRDIKNISKEIIPFFNKYNLRDNKLLSYIKFKFVIEKLNSIEKNKKWFSYDYSNEYNELMLDLIILSTNMNPDVKPSKTLEKIFNKDLVLGNIKEKDLNRILKNDISLKTMNEFNDYILKNYILNENYKNPLTVDFINGLFDADGWITLKLSRSSRKKINMGWEYGIVSDKRNAKVLFEIKKYFNTTLGAGNINYLKSENTARYVVTKTDCLNNIFLKIYGINDYLELFYKKNLNIGPIIKDKKIWIILRLYLLYMENLTRIETDLNIKNLVWFTILKYSYIIKPDHLKSKESYFDYIDRMNLKLNLNLDVNSYKKSKSPRSGFVRGIKKK